MEIKNHIIVEPVSNFKKVALEALRGHWKSVFFIGFIYYICFNLPGVFIDYFLGAFTSSQEAMSALMTGMPVEQWLQEYGNSLNSSSYVSTIYSLLVGGPFALGLTYVWLNIIRKKPIDAELVFNGFSDFLRAFTLNIFRGAIIILGFMLFIVPGIYFYYRYCLAYYVLTDNPKISPIGAMRLSAVMTSGNKLKMFTLDLSFLGWLLLSVVVMVFVLGPITMMFMTGNGSELDMLFQTIAQTVILALVLPFVFAYRNVSVAMLYRRVSEPLYAQLSSSSE